MQQLKNQYRNPKSLIQVTTCKPEVQERSQGVKGKPQMICFTVSESEGQIEESNQQQRCVPQGLKDGWRRRGGWRSAVYLQLG